jgi:branched-chain amino acid transport system ATP-binding protein
MTALAVNDLVVPRMGSPIVRGVSLGVEPGEITVLLGANGAGKTTLLEAISGVIPATSGSVTLDGRDLLSMSRDRRARIGLSHVEQGRTVFPDLTVEENLAVVTRSSCDDLFEMFPSLAKRRSSRAGLLSGGEQQMLVIARALATDPQMLMIDEMSLGLAPIIVSQLVPMVAGLAERGIGVLLVEQFAPLALSIGHRAVVMSRGEVAYDGGCRELLDDPNRLREIYLGA